MFFPDWSSSMHACRNIMLISIDWLHVTMAPNNAENDSYMILRADRTWIGKFLQSLCSADSQIFNFLETTESKWGASRPGWLEEAFSLICLVIIPFFCKLLEFTGYVLEYILNLLSHNNGIFGLPHNLFHGTRYISLNNFLCLML